ncbi:hypothetical protein [Streptomyces sp. NBC_01615]|uniref:hypothetical protein n=1 Tax=Streptomyces sp. NBC_01615 TaxID=2975898 RepID=UPI003863AD09
MSQDEDQIRTLIEHWAAAVRGLAAVLRVAGAGRTLGLRKEQGRWTVAHEYHSFPHD